MKITKYVFVLFGISVLQLSAQFVDNFDSDSLNGWFCYSGDGNAIIKFSADEGIAEIMVDASNDQNNIWWAFIKREISGSIDIEKLIEKNYELRVEAKIKSSEAPRRVNLHFNTQRTTDFHSHLMEFEIPDTVNWHTISMTTKDFDVMIGDTLNAQLALMDWGLKKYHLFLDYFKIDVVDKSMRENDLGNIIPYHPVIEGISNFNDVTVAVKADIVSTKYPDENFSGWKNNSADEEFNIITASGDQIIFIKWDKNEFKDKVITGHGLLELSIENYLTGEFSLEELGQIRLAEIIGGDKEWDSRTITLSKFSNGKNIDEIINSQPIYDLNLASQSGSKRYLTVSKHVLRRIQSGETLGLAIKALGPIVASFRNGGEYSPKLYYNSK